MSEEMVIFAKVYDLLTWLIPQTETFPKAQRFVVTRRLQTAALDLQELLIEANVPPDQAANARAACATPTPPSCDCASTSVWRTSGHG